MRIGGPNAPAFDSSDPDPDRAVDLARQGDRGVDVLLADCGVDVIHTLLGEDTVRVRADANDVDVEVRLLEPPDLREQGQG